MLRVNQKITKKKKRRKKDAKEKRRFVFILPRGVPARSNSDFNRINEREGDKNNIKRVEINERVYAPGNKKRVIA